jgi:hypothetical protein
MVTFLISGVANRLTLFYGLWSCGPARHAVDVRNI